MSSQLLRLARMGGMASTAAAAARPELPVDILEEIFLRLDDAADLVRVSAVCASFHRLIFNGNFLHRFRSLHRPPILGFLFDCHGKDTGFSFYPIELPHRSASAARALARAADFSISSFLEPIPYYWHVRDVRDGRILLSRHNASHNWWSFFEYLMVYDPLHCRRVQIPPIPDDLMTTMVSNKVRRGFDPFLVPAALDKDNLSFQVMCNMVCQHNVETLLYSSVTQEWHGVASISTASCKRLNPHCQEERYYARGCFYWVSNVETRMLVLDMLEMRFSMVDLPPGSEGRDKAVVEIMEDRVGLLILGDNTLDLYSTLRDIADHAKDWRHDHRIRLLDDYFWSFAGGVVEGYTLLVGLRQDECKVWESCHHKEPAPNAHYFTLEVESFVVKQLCVLKVGIAHPNFLYASFPPPFAPPRI
ncbi:unnamed protein product [Urochloa decumbens]|uniref:F-box domain-containing protein n=1 Tax=Urochloa decumbens TaxID=240449 RepID=A0ABC8VWJ1_9POAL